MRTNELVDTVVDDEMRDSLVIGEDGDEWNGETQAILDPESEVDEIKINRIEYMNFSYLIGNFKILFF